MTKEKRKSQGGLFGKLKAKMSGKGDRETVGQESVKEQESQQMIEEFEAVKRNPGHLTGWDFDRAFEFIERYPDSAQAEILIGQIYATTGQELKGLSYASAVKVLERMPNHAGSDSIIKGMYSIEKEYIGELRSDVIASMLKAIPDHPLSDELTTALARKNLTNAYDFVTANPENDYTPGLIKAMFDRDPNLAVLLLQEKMDHPHVKSIFDGIYNITRADDIAKLTPDAIIFILDVAPDHSQAAKMIEVLVEHNYIKAYDFVKMHPDHALVEVLKERILERKPELAKLFEM